ncbi:MAG: hypothetical protein U0T77_10455 [Chitinophagales bacterium]
MNTISTPKWSASITIGMQKGYTDERISLKIIKSYLQEIQEIQIKREQLYLSANFFMSDIVLSGQDEPHVNFNFINYPRFPSTEAQLKNGVLEIARYLMDKMEQNRIVISFDKEIIMLEISDQIDENITK